jgi:hypothetical protein
MRVKTGIESGKITVNHNEAQARDGPKDQAGIKSGSDKIAANHKEAQTKIGLKVQTSIKSGKITANHNEALARVS